MSVTYKPLYAAGSAAYTISPENVATSATFVAGVESGSVSNISNLYMDWLISGLWTCGTTPTVSTSVQAFLVPPLSDDLASSVTWPDVFDGTASAETVTSAAILSGLAYFVGAVVIDATTSNRAYYLRPTSVVAVTGMIAPPSRHVLFVTHNSAVTSNTTTGNHAWYGLAVQLQGV